MPKLFPVIFVRRGTKKPQAKLTGGHRIGFEITDGMRESQSSFNIDIPDPRLARFGELMQDTNVPMLDLLNEHTLVLNQEPDADQRKHLRCLMTDMLTDFSMIVAERQRSNLFRGPKLPMNAGEAVLFFKRALQSGTAEDIGRCRRELTKFGWPEEVGDHLALQAAS